MYAKVYILLSNGLRYDIFDKTLLVDIHHHAPYVLQPYFGQVWGWSPTLGKVGGLEPSGTPECLELDNKVQNTSHWGVLGVIGNFWNVDIENGLALAIRTSAAQVMGKRRARSQTGSLTPDHKKSGIDLFPTSELRVRHGVGKISTRDTTLI